MADETRKRSGWSELLHTEDYWAVWLGLALIAAAMAFYLPRPPDGLRAEIAAADARMASAEAEAPIRTLAWYEGLDAKAKLKATSLDHGKRLTRFFAQPHDWDGDPLHALVGDAARAAASHALKTTKVSAYNRLPSLAGVCLVLALVFGVGVKAMGGSFRRFCLGFVFVFGVAVLSYMAAQQSLMKEYGIGYAAWAILFGMIISNTVGTPRWVEPAVRTEFFIKTGLVLLGAEILFGKIVTIGIPGIFVAWLVTPTVLIVGFWAGNHFLKMPSKTLNVTICAAASVCGVSAAIATAAACRAKK